MTIDVHTASLNQLRDYVHQNAKNHGFHDKPRSFGDDCSLLHSEVSEAYEAWRNGHEPAKVWYGQSPRSLHGPWLAKPEGIPTELADVFIRALDSCGLLGVDLGEDPLPFHLAAPSEGWHWEEQLPSEPVFGDYCDLIHNQISTLSVFASHLKRSNRPSSELGHMFDGLIASVLFTAVVYGIPIVNIIGEKLAYNATRPRMHGGKKV